MVASVQSCKSQLKARLQQASAAFLYAIESFHRGRGFIHAMACIRFYMYVMIHDKKVHRKF